jgi:hypothetical protein
VTDRPDLPEVLRFLLPTRRQAIFLDPVATSNYVALRRCAMASPTQTQRPLARIRRLRENGGEQES